MGGLFFLIILGLVLWYEIFIYKSYKKFILKNGYKIKYKLLFISLILLPFYDPILAYFKSVYIASETRQVKVTYSGEIYKESLNYFNEEKNNMNKINSEKIYFAKKDLLLDSLIIYEIYQKEKNYLVMFKCYNLYPEQVEEFYKIKKEIENKYKPINLIYDSFVKINSNFYNECTKELLMETKNINKYTYSSDNSLNIKIPYFNLDMEHFNYVFKFYNYGFNDFLINNEFFDIKLFFYNYYLFVTLIFFILIFYIKNIFKNIVIILFLIFLPILVNYFFNKTTFENLDLIKKDLIIKNSDINKDNLKIGIKKEYKEGLYIIERIPYYDNEGNLVLEKTKKIYRNIYSVENFFGLYNFKIEVRF